MAPPLTIQSGAPSFSNIKDFGPQSLDERTRNALEVFENAVRPAGLAASGSDGEKVRSRSTKLLDKECRALVNAGEQLLASVAKLTDCPMLVLLLQKLPRLLTRQAVMIALSDVMPELLDRECLKAQVDQMQKRQLTSTTQYLQELGAVRSRLRSANARGADGSETPAKSHSMQSAVSVLSRRGSFKVNGGGDLSSSLRERRLSNTALKRPDKTSAGGLESRRASFSEKDEEIHIQEKAPVDDDDNENQETLEPRRTPSTQSISRKARKSMTVVNAASAALAFKRSQALAAESAEVGPEFGEVHNYVWDAVEHLDKGLQVIICKVIAEKLQCFKTQKEATNLAELRALCKRMESYLKGTAVEEHERRMEEVLAEMAARDLDIRRLTETIQANAETAEEAKKKLLKTMDEKDKLRDNIQRELVEAQAKLESSQFKVEELTQQVSKLKEAEALQKKERSALQKDRKKVLQFAHKADGGISNIKEFFYPFLPKLVSHVSKELRDPWMQEQLMQTIESLQRDLADAEKKHQSLVSRIKNMEKEMSDLSVKNGKLEQWKVTLEEQNAALQQRLGELESDMLQFQSNFLDHIHRAPAYMSLREEYEILKCECEGITTRSQMLQVEINRKDEEKAQLQGQIEERDAMIARLEDEVRDVAASQLHPSKVAQLRADLKRTKHECEALTTANEVLRNTVEAIQEKLEQPGKRNDATLENEVAMIKDMCGRTIHNRLYEDAVRRQDRDGDSPSVQHAQSWAACVEKRPQSASSLIARSSSLGSQAVTRSRSEPASRMVQHLLQTNAQNLRDMLDEPLFHHNLRLPVSPARPPELSNLPGMQTSPTDKSCRSASVTPRDHDFAELSNIVSEIVPRSHPHSRVQGTSRPPSVRSGSSSRSPCRPRCISRFGTESPTALSPPPQRAAMPTELVRTSRQPSDTDPPAKRGSFAEAVAELQAENQRSRPESAEKSKQGERQTTPVGIRGILDPNEKEEELPWRRQAMPGGKPRSTTNSPQQLPGRATPRLTYPLPHPRVAASLLPTVRPRSARPPPLVPFLSTSPRPQSCDP